MKKIIEIWDGIYDLPPVLAFAIIITPSLLAIAINVNIFFEIHHRNKCLDSPDPRRWHARICETYTDEWLEVNPYDDDGLYFYNEAPLSETTTD